jgi:multicomponent Na+:H+ antiporter subunit B
MLPIVLIFCAYITLFSHLIPGCGFVGGALFALFLILVGIAFGSQLTGKLFRESVRKLMESGGLLLIIIVGLVGILFGSNFFTNLPIWPAGFLGDIFSAGYFPLFQIGLIFEIGASLTIIFYYMIGEGRE